MLRSALRWPRSRQIASSSRVTLRLLSAEAPASKPGDAKSAAEVQSEGPANPPSSPDAPKAAPRGPNKNVTADLGDAILPYGRDRLILFVDDERWRYQLISALNAAHVAFWYFNWVYVFPDMTDLPTMIAPGGMSLAALLGGFFYWQASQSIAGVFYNRISREVELLPYSPLGARNEPMSISFRDIQLSQRSTDHFLFVKRRDDKLFMTLDRSAGTVVHEDLLLACLAGEQLVVNKIMDSEAVAEVFKKATPLPEEVKPAKTEAPTEQLKGDVTDSAVESAPPKRTKPAPNLSSPANFMPPVNFKQKKKGKRRR